MNVKHTKRPEMRVDMKFLSSLGIKTFGDDNLYPQVLRDIVNSSPSGRTCIERRSTYIEGDGLASIALSEAVCNLQGETVDEVHHLCADDIAYYDGFALHVNYNIFGQIVSVAHVPFESCRLEEEDGGGVVSHVVVHPDWRGKKTRNGKALKVSNDTIETFAIFNPSPQVVQQQIVAAGGIEFYKGQILYSSRDGRNRYPLPLVDVILTDMSSDEGLSNVNYRNTRCNFLPAGMLVSRRSQGAPMSDDEREITPPQDSGFAEEVERLQGDEQSLNILQVEIETEEDKPEFVPFKANNYDKDFTATAAAVVDNIYSVLNQEGFGRLRKGSIGFADEILASVKREYSEQVTKQQRMLSRAYKAIFEHWAAGEIPYEGSADVVVLPLVKTISNNE